MAKQFPGNDTALKQAEEWERHPPPAGFKLRQTIRGHTGYVLSVAWSPNGSMLASGSGDHTVRLWNPLTGQRIRSLEGHTDVVVWVSFSPDGRLLGSKSSDGTVRLWRTDTWENVSILYEYCDQIANLSLYVKLRPGPLVEGGSGLIN